MVGHLHTEVSVVFKNVQFHRATHIPKEGGYISMIFEVVCFGNGSMFSMTGRQHLTLSVSHVYWR